MCISHDILNRVWGPNLKLHFSWVFLQVISLLFDYKWLIKSYFCIELEWENTFNTFHVICNVPWPHICVSNKTPILSSNLNLVISCQLPIITFHIFLWLAYASLHEYTSVFQITYSYETLDLHFHFCYLLKMNLSSCSSDSKSYEWVSLGAYNSAVNMHHISVVVTLYEVESMGTFNFFTVVFSNKNISRWHIHLVPLTWNCSYVLSSEDNKNIEITNIQKYRR